LREEFGLVLNHQTARFLGVLGAASLSTNGELPSDRQAER